MKKIVFFAVFMLFASTLFSQAWLRNLPANKSKGQLTFFDYQKAFNDYWAPFNVVKGHYYVNGVKKKAVGWKQFKRWEYDMEGKINPTTGEFPNKTAQQVYDEFNATNQQKLLQTTASWSCLGTSTSAGGYNGIGRISCIAFHPTDNNTYWVGAGSGGLWVTTNNGSTWTCLTDNTGVLAVSDIVIPTDYATSHTIYIATGDRDAWDNNSIGVLKSTDAGVTWTTTGISFALSASKMVSRILIDPNNNQTLIAATSNGVYKTTNGGTTWNTQLSTINFIDMEYKPGDFNTLYGCTYANGGSKIYVSANGGTSWTQAFTDANAYRIELAVSANQPTWVYALIEQSDDGLYGVYKSTTSGTAYTQVYAGTTKNLLGWQADGSDAGGQGFYDLSIAASPTNASTVLVGGVNTWRSTTGGTAWTIVNHWSGSTVQAVHADKHTLKFRSDGSLFETNDGGVYISANNGTSWTDKTNGMVTSQMYKLSVSATVATEVLTGLQDNGTKLLSGGVWTDANGGDGMECIIDYSNVNIQYGTNPQGTINRTTNHWSSSTDITPASAGTGAWVTPIIMVPTSNTTLYAGYADVWKSMNSGTAWTKISTMNTSEYIRSMAIAPSNTQVLYVAALTKIWKTTTGGTAWTDITGTLPVSSGNITSIAVKNDDANTLWVTMGGYNATTVYQSSNAGTAWTNISTGLPSLPAYSIVQNKQVTSEVQLYVGTELGVYFKKGTNNWTAFNTGLPNVKIGELEIYYATSGQNSKLRAATYGRGLWETYVYFNTCTPPATPTVGTITQPNCTLATGSVVISGLPASGTWTLTRLPGSTNTTGTGSSTTITGLAAGTYTYTVTDSALCTSSATANIVINAQPVPTAPTLGSLTQPTCTLATGSVVLNGLPATGTWLLTRTPGGDTLSGTGVSISLSGLAAGTYTYTVTNTTGCTSIASANVVINAQPATPPTPVISANILVLQSSAASGNQWYNQSGPISGATSQNYTVTANGSYYVIVTVNGCPSDTSNIIQITNVGIELNQNAKEIKIYPNPVTNELTIEIVGNKAPTAFEIHNAIGQLILKDNILNKKVISTINFPLGVYIVKLENGKTFEFKKVVKE
ncbi:MAG: T9SS type A sorting domain-containing protein [Bacteroidota bacterium]